MQRQKNKIVAKSKNIENKYDKLTRVFSIIKWTWNVPISPSQ